MYLTLNVSLSFCMCQAFGLDPLLQVKTSKESVHTENTTQPSVPTMSSATVSSSDPPPVLGDEPTAQVENSQSINDSGIGLEGIE